MPARAGNRCRPNPSRADEAAHPRPLLVIIIERGRGS